MVVPIRTAGRASGTSGPFHGIRGLGSTLPTSALPVYLPRRVRLVLWSSRMPSLNPVPLQFLCEHSPAKSRVFAILQSSNGPSTLRAVLTCHDPVLAQRAADVLTALARGASGEVVTALAKEIESVLPAAPAASFREALSRLRDQSWPEAHASPVRWEHLLVIERENTRQSAAPDFAALFQVRTCHLDHADEDEYCDVCDEWQLTPRTADMLYTALEILSDEAHEDADDNGDEPVLPTDEGYWLVFDRLPRITRGMGADWRHQFGRACADLARDLEAGERPQPRCTAEEMALHLAVRDAPGCLEMAREADDEHHQALPEHYDDYDWDRCASLLFEDHDVLMLFDKSFDGVEDPQGELNQTYGIGDLRATQWFQFFAHLDPRDPHRTFRRLETARRSSAGHPQSSLTRATGSMRVMRHKPSQPCGETPPRAKGCVSPVVGVRADRQLLAMSTAHRVVDRTVPGVATPAATRRPMLAWLSSSSRLVMVKALNYDLRSTGSSG